LGISKNRRSGFGNFDLLLLATTAQIPDEISPGETVEPVSGHGWEMGDFTVAEGHGHPLVMMIVTFHTFF